MYILVTYDIREERVRRKVRALLRRYSLAMLTYSTYIGRGGRSTAERIASIISGMLEPGDKAAVILLQDFQYELLLDIESGKVAVRSEKSVVRVFYGKRSGATVEQGVGRDKR